MGLKYAIFDPHQCVIDVYNVMISPKICKIWEGYKQYQDLQFVTSRKQKETEVQKEKRDLVFERQVILLKSPLRELTRKISILL